MFKPSEVETEPVLYRALKRRGFDPGSFDQITRTATRIAASEPATRSGSLQPEGETRYFSEVSSLGQRAYSTAPQAHIRTAG